MATGADPGGGRWGARPPLGQNFTIKNALFNSIQAPIHHWAPTPGRNPVSAPGQDGIARLTLDYTNYSGYYHHFFVWNNNQE